MNPPALDATPPEPALRAAEALALSDHQPAGPVDAVPAVRPGQSVADALAHLTGQLTALILRHAEAVAGGTAPEPVHDMRVAVRRLRTALSVFQPVAGGSALDAARAGLKVLAGHLGAARDWDVFLAETAPPIQAAFAGDARITSLAHAAEAARSAAHAGLQSWLAGPEFQHLMIAAAEFAALRPWQAEDEEARAVLPDSDIAAFAPAALSRRFARIERLGPDLSGLDHPALHRLRKDAKRLRYTSEFFAPLYGRKRVGRFVRRLGRLQDALGHLNDGATAAALMAGLPEAERGFAAGVVQGFIAARDGDSRRRIGKAWTKLRRTGPFWR